MTKELQELKKAIQEANPEIMELKFGCEIEYKNAKWEITWRNNNAIFLCFWGKEIRILYGNRILNIAKYEKYKILGRQINLEDVLVALEKKIMSNFSYSSSGLRKNLRKPFFQTIDRWQFNKSLDWHDKNKPETIKFLHSLICKKI